MKIPKIIGKNNREYILVKEYLDCQYFFVQFL